MSDNRNDNCYGDMLKQFKKIQKRLEELQESVTDLQERYDAAEEVREGCPDAIVADKAAYEAVREICIDSLFDVKPKGDA